MRIIIFFSLLLLCMSGAMAQTIQYDVVKGSRKLGSMEVKRDVTGKGTYFKVESNVEIKVLLTFKIYYFLEEFFENGFLKKGNAHNNLNDKVQKQSVVLGDDQSYVNNLNGNVHQLNESNVNFSIPHLYYNEPIGKEKIFSQQFANAGYGIDDFKNITLHFFPVASRTEFPGQEDEFKKYLETLETRIVTMINPACNKEHNPDKPSATRYPEKKVTVDTDTST